MSTAEWKRSRSQAHIGSAFRLRKAGSVLDLLKSIGQTLERFEGESSVGTEFPSVAQELVFQSQLAGLHAALDACEGKLPQAQSALACRQVEKAAQEVCRKTLQVGLSQEAPGRQDQEPA